MYISQVITTYFVEDYFNLYILSLTRVNWLQTQNEILELNKKNVRNFHQGYNDALDCIGIISNNEI